MIIKTIRNKEVLKHKKFIKQQRCIQKKDKGLLNKTPTKKHQYTFEYLIQCIGVTFFRRKGDNEWKTIKRILDT